ncbi:sodium channel protein 1 brain-like [Gigantopelta aegis]|uniref:sodium channel protein 1 brain-like n=1 Tax=Gigantopelta aegis TaxID=1735272 RepID=UPI001B8894B5|nr:sodium channel protein 1 brain-like [Gigantopelta aegis]
MKEDAPKPDGRKVKPETDTCYSHTSKLLSFHLFSENSYQALLVREQQQLAKHEERQNTAQKAHLVGGELIFGNEEEEEDVIVPDPNLREGNLLLENYGIFPTSYIGKPIEEIDPGITEKTFVIISTRMGKRYINRFSATRSFFLFPPWKLFRKMAIYIATNQFFDYFIILTILTNCVFLAMPNMMFTEMSEYVFLAIYTLEMCVKVTARGFFLDHYTYLRDPWNWLDFIVIVSAFLTLTIQLADKNLDIGNLQGLRTFRVLRALRTVSIIPGLKTIVGALLRAFKMLVDVIMLTMFCLMVFALFALQVYMGVLRHKCVLDIKNYTATNSMSYDAYYNLHIRNNSNWYLDKNGGYLLCGNITGSGKCPENYTCLPDIDENPNFGYTNFDHFGWAMLNSFQLLTLDFWEDTYDKIIRATGPWNLVFFVMVIFLGSFYLINLMLAVVAMSYEEEAVYAGKEKERELNAKQKKKPNPIYELAKLTVNKRVSSNNEGKHKTDDSARDSPSKHKGWSHMLENKMKPGEKPKDPVNPLKPMVKKVSKDSGYSSRSQNSGAKSIKYDSHEHLNNIESESEASGSGVGIRTTVKDLIKQESRGNDLARQKEMERLKLSASSIMEEDSSMNNSNTQDKIGENVIIKAEDLDDWDSDKGDNVFIDRNCHCCRRCCVCFIPWLKFERLLYTFTADPLFDLFITICIILNTVIMSTEHYGQPIELEQTLKISNYVFTLVFTTEACLKILALNKWYFKSSWNLFDLTIVIAGLVDLALEDIDGLSVIRIFRLLRVFKLAQSWPTMRLLLSIILSTLGALANLTVVLGIILYIFAVIGLQLFNTKYTADKFAPDLPPRWNFDDFGHAIVMVFRVLCGEWIEPLWDCMRAADELCMVVFLPTLVLGNFIVLNLFLALLLNAFATDTLGKNKDTKEANKFFIAWQRIKNLCCCKTVQNTVKPLNEKTATDDGAESTHECEETKAYARFHEFRKFLLLIVDHKIFETIVLIVIFASSITLAFEDVYLDENVVLKEALNYMNIIFCVLFSIEMILKWFAYGITKYFTSFWTLLDFVIVVISVISLVSELLGISNITAFRSLRTLRALRPLRAISRWQGMKVVTICECLMMAIPAIVNVLLVCLVFWLIFSIMGVQFFAGKFFKCVDADGNKLLPTVVANKSECFAKNYTWKNSKVNFDSVLSGYLALFQVATFEGWMEVMEDAIDATQIDQQPARENGFYYYFYFIIFIVFGSFFTLNLFIGVIIDNFNVLKKKYDGSYLDMFLTSSQMNYYNTLKKLGNKKPQKTIKRPKLKCQAFFFDIASSTKFELLIVLIIFLNMIVMAIDHYNESDYIVEILNILNVVFTSIFTLEAIIKLIGLRWHYFRQAWNVFDFIIVVLSIVVNASEVIEIKTEDKGIVMRDFLSTVVVTPTLLRVVRIFRIGRVLRLIKAAKGIRKLLFALIISLPAIFNIGALLFLLLYIYAIIGMSSFGNVKITGRMDDIVNFKTFFNSFMLMLRLSTSAGWNDILDPLLISEPDCDPNFKTLPNGTKVPDGSGDCGIPWLAVPFMVSYIVIIYLIVINMYIAVILENFNQAHQQEEVGITEDDFDMFYSVWERYDPHATQFIKYDQLQDFVADLDEPLGHPKPNEIALVAFNLPIVEGDKIHCIDILIALVRSFLGEVDETQEFKELKTQIEMKFQDVFPSRVNMAVKSTTMQRKKEDVAARTLQRAWKSFKTQRMLKNITSLAIQQNLSHTMQHDFRPRANSIVSLGRRLSLALTSFFGSRPGSGSSLNSAGRSQVLVTVTPIGRKNITKNTLQMPSVNAMYENDSKDDKFQL